MSTTFPNATQSFKRWQDLTGSDLTAYVQYINALNAGNWTQARNIFNNSQLSDKMLPTADDFNAMCDTIVECKELYEAPTTSAQGIQDFMNQFTYKGVWDANNISQYKKFSIVRYADANYGTFLYIANQDITATTNPWSNSTSSSPQWLRIVPVSTTNTTSTFKGIWSSSINYVIGDVVFDNNIMWIATANNTNSVPSDSNANWKLIVNFNNYIAQYTTTQPANMPVGGIWFKKLS